MEGSGKMVVIAVGIYSQAGIIVGLLQNNQGNIVIIFLYYCLPSNLRPGLKFGFKNRVVLYSELRPVLNS